MFERFTAEARRVVVLAQEESRIRADPDIGTEHLLLAFVFEDTGDALLKAGFNPESARHQMAAMSPAPKGPSGGHIPFTPGAKRVLQEALEISNGLGQNHIAAAHLLCALVRVPDGRAMELLTASGIDLPALAARAEELARASAPDDGQRLRSIGITASAESALQGRFVPGPYDLLKVIQQRDHLRSALKRYGRHEEGCDPDRGCTCGLAQVLAEDVEDEGA